VAGSSDVEADGPNCTNGFAFEGADAGGLDYALNRAVDAFYNDRAWFRGLQSRVMRMDFSWNRPALQFTDLYYAAIKS
jgi:starch synthase